MTPNELMACLFSGKNDSLPENCFTVITRVGRCTVHMWARHSLGELCPHLQLTGSTENTLKTRLGGTDWRIGSARQTEGSARRDRLKARRDRLRARCYRPKARLGGTD